MFHMETHPPLEPDGLANGMANSTNKQWVKSTNTSSLAKTKGSTEKWNSCWLESYQEATVTSMA